MEFSAALAQINVDYLFSSQFRLFPFSEPAPIFPDFTEG